MRFLWKYPFWGPLGFNKAFVTKCLSARNAGEKTNQSISSKFNKKINCKRRVFKNQSPFLQKIGYKKNGSNDLDEILGRYSLFWIT